MNYDMSADTMEVVHGAVYNNLITAATNSTNESFGKSIYQ